MDLSTGGLVKTVLGTNKCVKCVVADGESRYVRDTSLLLQLLDIEHPIGQYVVSVCQRFARQYKTGGDTLLFFISSFTRAARLLLDQGIPTDAVSRILQASLEDIIEHVNKMAVHFYIKTESLHDSGLHKNSATKETDITTSEADEIAADSAFVNNLSQLNKEDEKLGSKITTAQKSCIVNKMGENMKQKEITVDDEIPFVHLQMKTDDVDSEQDLDWFFGGLAPVNNHTVEGVSGANEEDIEKLSSNGLLNMEKFDKASDIMDESLNENPSTDLSKDECHENSVESITLQKDILYSGDTESHFNDKCHYNDLMDDIKKFKLDIENDLKILANRNINSRHNGVKKSNHVIPLTANVFDVSDSEYDDWLESVKSKKHINKSVSKHLTNTMVYNAESASNDVGTNDMDVEFDECFERSTNEVDVSRNKLCEDCIVYHVPTLRNYVDKHSKADKCDEHLDADRIQFPIITLVNNESCSNKTNKPTFECVVGKPESTKLNDFDDEFDTCFDDTKQINGNTDTKDTSYQNNKSDRQGATLSGSTKIKTHTGDAHSVTINVDNQPLHILNVNKESGCRNATVNRHDKKVELCRKASSIPVSSQPTISGLDSLLSSFGKGNTSTISRSTLKLSSRHFQDETSDNATIDKDNIVDNMTDNEAEHITGIVVNNQTSSGAVENSVCRNAADEEVITEHQKEMIKNALVKSQNSQLNVHGINSLLLSLGKQKNYSTLSPRKLTDIKTRSRHLVKNVEEVAETQINHKDVDKTATSQPLGATPMDTSTQINTCTNMPNVYKVNNTAETSNHNLQDEKCDVSDTSGDKVMRTHEGNQLDNSESNSKSLDTMLCEVGISQTWLSTCMTALSKMKERSRHLTDDQFDTNQPPTPNAHAADQYPEHMKSEDYTGSLSNHNDANCLPRETKTVTSAPSDTTIRHVHTSYSCNPTGTSLGIHEIVSGLCVGVEEDTVTVIEEIVQQALDSHDIAGDCRSLHLERLFCHSVVGASHRQPRLVDGLVTVTSTDSVAALHTLNRPCNALIVNGDITPQFKHKGYKKAAQSSTVLGVETLLHGDHKTKTDQWMTEIVSVLDELNIGMILSRGQICDEVQWMCTQTGRLALPSVPYQLLDVLCESSHTDMVTYLTLATQINICKHVTVLPWQPDWIDRKHTTPNSKQEIVISTETKNPQTVVFSEPTHPLADLKEQEFWDSLHRVTSAISNGSLLLGGGRTEAQCVEYCLQRTGDKIQSCHHDPYLVYLPQAFEVLAGVFQEYVCTVQTNISLSEPSEALESRRASCETRQDPTIGMNNVANRQFIDNYYTNCCSSAEEDMDISSMKNDSGKNSINEQRHHLPTLYDDYTSKIQAWKVAMETMAIILRTDSYIVTGITRDDIKTNMGSNVVTL